MILLSTSTFESHCKTYSLDFCPTVVVKRMIEAYVCCNMTEVAVLLPSFTSRRTSISRLQLLFHQVRRSDRVQVGRLNGKTLVEMRIHPPAK